MKTTRAVKARYWQRHVARWQTSHLSRTKYCRKHGLKPYQFTYWTHKEASKSTPASFIEIDQDKVRQAGPITIQITMPGGVVVRLTSECDTETLKSVFRAVREVLC